MRALILLILCCAFAINAFAVERRITVTREGKYGKQTSVLAMKGSKWVCATELSPRVPMFRAVAPTLKQITAFEKAGTKLDQVTCKDRVFFDDTARGDKVYMACATDEAARKLLDAVGDACGRH